MMDAMELTDDMDTNLDKKVFMGTTLDIEVFMRPVSEWEPEDKATHNCNICRRRFPEKSHLRYHLREHRTKPTRCVHCNRICRFLNSKQGFNISAPKESPRYVCRFCHGDYERIIYLKYEKMDEEKAKCLICHDIFKNVNDVWMHFLLMHYLLPTSAQFTYNMFQTWNKIFRSEEID